jgi:hypothetical protein
MAEDVTTNLTEVAADRVTLWSAEWLEHRDIRKLFVGSEEVTRPAHILQQLGEETDELLVYRAPTGHAWAVGGRWQGTAHGAGG